MANDWYVRVMGEVIGPMGPSDVQDMVDAKHLGELDDIRRGTSGDWKPANSVKGLRFGPPPMEINPLDDLVLSAVSTGNAPPRQVAQPSSQPQSATRPYRSMIKTATEDTHSNLPLILGIGGAVAIAIGVFCPFLGLPFGGSLTYFAKGKGDGLYVLIAGLVAGGGAILNLPYITIVGSSIAAGFTAQTISRFTIAMGKIERLDGPFSELGNAVIDSVDIRWGAAIIISGILSCSASAATTDDGNDESGSRLAWLAFISTAVCVIAGIAIGRMPH